MASNYILDKMDRSELKDELGKFLKKVRLSRGLLLLEVADIVDMSHSYLSHIETGNKKGAVPSKELLDKLFILYRLDEKEQEEFLKIYLRIHLPKDFLINIDEKIKILLNE